MTNFKYAKKNRIYNLIWNMASDYSFTPLFIGNDIGSNPSFYFNIIIGLSYKYFGKDEIEDLFSLWENSKYEQRYDSLTWIGLGEFSYKNEYKKRPVLKKLREDYARDFFATENDLNRRNLSYRDISLFMVEAKHMANILGKDFRGTKKDETDLLNALCSIANNRSLKDQFIDIYERFFDFDKDIKRISIFKNHFNYKSSHLFERSVNDFNFNQTKDFNLTNFNKPLNYIKFKKRQKDESEIEDIFGRSIFNRKKLDLLENKICKKEDKHERLWFTKSYSIENQESRRNFNKAIDDNKKKYLKDKSTYDFLIKNLSKKFKNILNEENFDSKYKAKQGIINPRLSYRYLLNDGKIFLKDDRYPKNEISVDLLIDSSASMIEYENDLAIAAYILAKSLELANIKIRIISYLSYDSYTVLNILKDFDEKTQKDRIFSYHGRGFNRDSTALKAYRSLDKTIDNRFLIFMSDLSPVDLKPIYRKYPQINIPYESNQAFKLLEDEFRTLRKKRYKISLLTIEPKRQKEKFIKRAKRIFFDDFILLKSPKDLSKKASFLIAKNLKKSSRKRIQ